MLPGPRYWGLALLGCTSIIPILIGPIIIGVLVDYGGFSDREAGLSAGYGALYAAVMSAFAREAKSERCYGMFMMLQFGLAAAGLWGLPTLLPDMSAAQMYLGFLGLNLGALLLVGLLPANAADVAGVRIRAEEWRLLLTVPALGGLAALFFFEASNVGTDAYMERIGVLADFSDPQIGTVLGVSSLLGVPGAFAILLVGSRFGHRLPVLAGVSVGVVSLWGLMNAASYPPFFLWTCIHSVSWAFTTPYIQSVLADMDPGGAVVTAGGIASGAGAGAGPASMAILVSATDYGGVLVIGLGAYALAAVSITIAGRLIHAN